MARYYLYNATGIYLSGTCPDGMEDQMIADGYTLGIGDPPPELYPEVTLNDLKSTKWLEIKQARNQAEFGGFTWDGSAFDSDPTSQSRIQGASQLATLALMNAQPFSIDWTLADNSTRTLTAEDMLAVCTTMGIHSNTQHSLGRTKRQEIELATTPEEVTSINW